jgi:hypothetical protein
MEKSKQQSSNDDINFESWANAFCEVYGDNGKIALVWYAATIASSIIPDKIKHIPVLSIYGPPNSGKTTMAKSLMAMYQGFSAPFSLSDGTQAALKHYMETKRQAPIWFQEYTGDASGIRSLSIKEHYDDGHILIDEVKENTKTLMIRPLIIETNERLNDGLGTRSIQLSLTGHKSMDSYHKLIEMQNTGQLMRIEDEVKEALSDIRLMFDAHQHCDWVETTHKNWWGIDPEGNRRIIENWNLMLTIHDIAAYLLNLPFDRKEFRELVRGMILRDIKN